MRADSAARPPQLRPAVAYLRLRGRLLGRLLREIGWWRLTLLLPMVLLAVSNALVMAARHPVGQWVAPVLLAWTVLAAHRQRDDYRFLAAAAPGFRPWLAAEYALLALPAALGLAAAGAPGPAVLTLGLAGLAAWSPPARQDLASRHRWRSPFRSEAFEWVSGVRATKALGLWPVLVALATWQRASPLAPLAALVVWLLVLLACYGTPEPRPMVAVAARSARQFLRRRLALGLGYAAGTAAPFWLLLGLGLAGWGGALVVALAWLGLVALLVLAKYAFYPHATHIRLTQALLLAVAFLLVGQPIYPVLLLVAAGGLFWQSKRRLRRELGEEAIPPNAKANLYNTGQQ